jgi:hypothetical protein
MDREGPIRLPTELNGAWKFPAARGFSHDSTRDYEYRHQEELNIRPHVSPPHRVKVRERTWVGALILVVFCALGGTALAGKDNPPVQYKISIPTPPDFSTLDWLRGEWAGKSGPNGSSGDVRLTVSPDLGNHFLVFRGEVSLAATPTVPAIKESWMGILSAGPDATQFILRVFSSTGFITRYRLTVEGAEVRLNPEGGDFPPPGWLFRRIWARTGTDEFAETVQVAPPGKAFFDYYTAKFARVSSPPKTSPAP